MIIKILDIIINTIIIILLSGIYTKVITYKDLETWLISNRNYVAIVAISFNIIKLILSFYVTY
jgi:hypothetical protein